MAYTSTMAAALSGATVNQLRHWRHARTGPLLAPEISTAPRVFYSFRDLLALRTFVHLRQDASLQKIRLAISNLRDLGEIEHLASYQLVSDLRGNIQLIKGDEAAIDLVRHPEQTQLLVIMRDVIEPFPVRPGVVVPHLLRPRAHLSVDPDTQGGTPVIAGTRVPYDAVASLMREDVPAENVAEYYPAVTATAARDALDFAMYVDSYGRAARPHRRGYRRSAIPPDARKAGYDVIITRDHNQLSDPAECDAIKKSALHHIRYSQRREGMIGLGLALGSIIAAMPMVMDELEQADSQRLVHIVGLDPNRRYELIDPAAEPPNYWPH